MKLNKHTWILLFFPAWAHAQVQADFEDGSLESWDQLPESRWEISGADPVSGEYSLHHGYDNAEAATDHIYLKIHPPDLRDTLRYSFRIRHGYPPSRSNNWQFLMQAEFSGDGSPVSGMAFGVNMVDSDDLVSLWQIGNDGMTEVIVTQLNHQDSIGTEAAPLFMLTRDPEGLWSIAVSQRGDPAGLVPAGSGLEQTPVTGRYLGIRYAYSSAQDRKLWIDDVMAEGSFQPDIRPPVVDSIRILYPDRVEVVFNEPVVPTEGFSCQWKTHAPDSVSFTGNRLLLWFPASFPNREQQQIVLSGISDGEGNVLNEAKLSCMLDLAEYGDVVINEVMSDPWPPVYLPDCEYIELFNRYTGTIFMDGWMVGAGSREIPLPPFAIAPGEYVVLTSAEEGCNFPGTKVIALFLSASFLSNDGNDVALLDPFGRVVHHLHYPPPASLDPLKADGGWSLERMDPDRYCAGLEQWAISSDASGGTPGRINSTYQVLPDEEKPVLVRYGLPESRELSIEFSERIIMEGSGGAGYLALDGSPLDVHTASGYDVGAYALFIATDSFSTGATHEVRLGDWADCAGNRMNKADFQFQLPELPAPGQVVINEVMFDPGDDGKEYIEIHNPSDAYFDLTDLKVRVFSGSGEARDPVLIAERSHLLPPGGYLVLTADPVRIMERHELSPETDIVHPGDWPALTNSGGCIFLEDRSDRVIDRMCFDPSMHHDLLAGTAGVALERIDPELPGTDSENWASASFASGYATPGSRNSQLTPGPAGDELVQICPEVVSPDMDGHQDMVRIDIHPPAGECTYSVLVTDLRGYRVCTLTEHAAGSRHETLFWKAEDDSGHLVPPGIYVIHVRIYDGTSEVVKRKAVAVTYR